MNPLGDCLRIDRSYPDSTQNVAQGKKTRSRCRPASPESLRISASNPFLLLLRCKITGEHRGKVGLRLVVEARHERVGVGIRPDSCCIEVGFAAPDQAGFLTEINDALEEALEEVDAEPLSDAGQAGMIWEVFVQGVPEVPTMR